MILKVFKVFMKVMLCDAIHFFYSTLHSFLYQVLTLIAYKKSFKNCNASFLAMIVNDNFWKYNRRQMIWLRVNKSAKITQDQKPLIFDFA